MVLTFSAGRLLLSPRELQVRFNAYPLQLMVLAEDIRLLANARLLLADAGAVRWQLTLDELSQLQAIGEFYGIVLE